MEEKDGKFVHGEWIEDDSTGKEAQGERAQGIPIDQRIDQVSTMVSTSFHQMLSLARDLVTTPEGHAHIEKQIQQASSQIECALNEILKSGEEILKSGVEKKDEQENPEKKKIRIE